MAKQSADADLAALQGSVEAYTVNETIRATYRDMNALAADLLYLVAGRKWSASFHGDTENGRTGVTVYYQRNT